MVILLLKGLKTRKMPFHSLGPMFDFIHFDLLGKIACNADVNLIKQRVKILCNNINFQA